MSPDRHRLLRRLLLGAILLQQAAIQVQAWQRDPFARFPLEDSAAYWDHAGAIAAGRLVADTPFLSAPLYPAFLGLLRALGAGIPAVLAVQVLLHVATAALLGRVARRHFREGGGTAAVALYGLLTGPAWQAGRLLNGSLQLLVTVLLWDRLEMAVARPSRGRTVLAGLLAGLAVLAHPPLLAALPVLLAWVAYRTRDAGLGSWPARLALAAVPACLAIAPATLHNWLACGEPILVSAQAGVTFYHGNAAGAVGVYHPIPGVSPDRQRQNRDAFRLAAAATGEPGWRNTSRWFLARGLEFWREHPGDAAVLLLRKAWWLAAGIVYGDLAMPVLERDDGFLPLLWLAPLPEAFLVLPGLAGLWWLWRRRHRPLLPMVLLAAVPCLVVLTFWYTPRYRMPAVPVLAAATVALGLEARSRGPARRLLAGAVLGAVLLPAGGRWLWGWDRPELFRPGHEAKAGLAFLRGGEAEAALPHLRRSLELRPGDPPTLAALAEALRQLGRTEEALQALREAAGRAPEDPAVRRTLGFTLAGSGRWQEAEAEFRRALAADPGDLQAQDGLASALYAQGRLEEAEALYREVLAAAPDATATRFNLAVLLQDRGRYREAAAELRRVLAREPGHAQARLRLAWLLATTGPPEGMAAAGREALALLRPLTGAEADPALLETRAAARAAAGDLSGAAADQERAVAALEAAGAPAETVAGARDRLARYRAGQPYRMPR